MTMTARRWLARTAAPAGLLALAILTGTGCARPRPAPVRDPAQRFAGSGFSIGTPPGADWYVLPSVRGRVQLAKKVGSEPVPTIVAAAWTADVDARPSRAEDLVGYKQRSVERLQRVETAYAITLTAVAVDRTLGAECVRWVQQEEESHHPSPALRGLLLLTTTYGVDCLHPGNPRRIVTAGYSERRVKASPSLVAPGQPIAEEGEAFLRSLRLTAPP